MWTGALCYKHVVSRTQQKTEAQRTSEAPIVVMKFGGSSVADLDRLKGVAKIVSERANAQQVVVVVSAMGRTTNDLVAQARALSPSPSARETDMLLTTGERHCMAMLALAIHARGHKAISLTGSQCGIITNHAHGRARIVEVRPFRVLDELSAGHIVIVGGFQGVSYKREVTTLGRGGSDTTAVALAGALGADCEIYSDVDGIYSADPRKVEAAIRLETIDYDEMQALAEAGAKVLHGQAVQLAQKLDVVLFARSTSDAAKGRGAQSVVRRAPAGSCRIKAVAADPSMAKIEVELAEPIAGAARIMAQALGGRGLRYLHMDDQRCFALISESRRDDVAVMQERIGVLVEALEGFTHRDGSTPNADAGPLTKIEYSADIGLISCIGSGIESNVDLTLDALAALEEANIVARAIHTDTNSLGFEVLRDQVDAGTSALHRRLVLAESRPPSIV